MKRDAPELYEVLKKTNIDVTKLGSKNATATKLKEEEVVTEPKPIPLVTTSKPGIDKVIPKFKSSLLKKTENVPQEKQVYFSSTTTVFIVLVVIVLLAVSFIVGFQIGQGKTKDTAGTPSKLLSGSEIVKPPPPTTEWTVRVGYYEKTSQANQLLEQLKAKGVTNIVRREEKYQGRTRYMIDIGPYSSELDAKNAMGSFKTKYGTIKDLSKAKIVEQRR